MNLSDFEKHDEAEAFRDRYKKEHAVCPKCFSDAHMSTLAGFALHLDNLESYRDLNECRCMRCGDKHLAHDRVPKP